MGLAVKDSRATHIASKIIDGDGSDPYSEYLKKHTHIDDKSDYSNSVSRKESGDMNNVHAITDSRRLYFIDSLSN